MLLKNTEKSNEKIRQGLISLWSEVFGDEKEYAELILPYLDFFDCFAVCENDELISSLYLLPCEIKCGNEIYKGKYLYAAATKEKFRGKGYMAKLINEALLSSKISSDFISLVPANEGLYGYYSRFGFETAMSRYVTAFHDLISDKALNELNLIFEENELNSLRRDSADSLFLYTNVSLNYAMDCYKFYDSCLYKLNEQSYFMYNDEEKCVIEFASKEDRFKENLAQLLKYFEGDITVYSPFELSKESKKEKCGMIYAYNSSLKEKKDIYMNLTLG